MKRYICNGCVNPIEGQLWAEYIQLRSKPQGQNYTSHTASTGKHYCNSCADGRMYKIRNERKEERARRG